MQELNHEYRLLKEQFAARFRSDSNNKLKPGGRVFVNGTECRVIYMTRYAFIAKAIHNGRTAVFDRETGYAIRNRKFRAQFC